MKTQISASDLEDLIFLALKKTPHCDEAISVSIYTHPADHPATGSNWSVASINAGGADVRQCGTALVEISRRLGPLYRVQ